MLNRRRNRAVPWWHVWQFWGLDAPVTAFCWTLASISFMDLPMVTPAAVVAVLAFAWYLSLSRNIAGYPLLHPLINMRRAKALRLVLVLILCWVLLACVGALFLDFAILVAVLMCSAHLPLLDRLPAWHMFSRSAALAVACSLPAAYCSINFAPQDMLRCSSVWNLTYLFFLSCLLRESWLLEEQRARRRSLLVSLGLGLLAVACLLSTRLIQPFERLFCYTIAMAAVALGLVISLRPWLGQGGIYIAAWLSLTLPPLLALLLV